MARQGRTDLSPNQVPSLPQHCQLQTPLTRALGVLAKDRVLKGRTGMTGGSLPYSGCFMISYTTVKAAQAEQRNKDNPRLQLAVRSRQTPPSTVTGTLCLLTHPATVSAHSHMPFGTSKHQRRSANDTF